MMEKDNIQNIWDKIERTIRDEYIQARLLTCILYSKDYEFKNNSDCRRIIDYTNITPEEYIVYQENLPNDEKNEWFIKAYYNKN